MKGVGWIVAFVLATLVAVVSVGINIKQRSDYQQLSKSHAQLRSDYASLNASYSQLTSNNAAARQKCVDFVRGLQNISAVYSSVPNYTDYQSMLNACQAEYPN